MNIHLAAAEKMLAPPPPPFLQQVSFTRKPLLAKHLLYSRNTPMQTTKYHEWKEGGFELHIRLSLPPTVFGSLDGERIELLLFCDFPPPRRNV